MMRFAGKCGVEEARRAYTELQPWSQTKEARIAIRHAGQLLRAARAVPPYQIRGQDSFMVYHAIMVLWTYSMMIRGRARKTGTTTPVRGAAESGVANGAILPLGHREAPVFLDGAPSDNQASIDGFVLMNSGRPCLRMASTIHRLEADGTPSTEATASNGEAICDLRYPSQIMRAGVALLEAKHPDVEPENGPPLSRALCLLMEELGSLR